MYEAIREQLHDEGLTDEEIQTFLTHQHNEALKSYDIDDELKYCSICGELLRKGSMSYYEGYHFDSCI